MEPLREGPGDSGRGLVFWGGSDGMLAVCSDAPQISQVLSDGWFWNVHRGHWPAGLSLLPAPLEVKLSGPVECRWFGCKFVDAAGRFDIAEMVALTMCTSGGLIPQA